jgi:hypothetical protein
VTPHKADQLCAFLAVLADILDGRYEVEPALLARVQHVLRVDEATSPPIERVSQFAEAVHELEPE